MAKTKSTPYSANHLMVIKMDSQTVPSFTEVRGKDWVSFGNENDYPYYLIDLYNKSAKHNAIINGKVNYILGSGWEIEEENPKLKAFLDQANPYESLNQVSRKFIHDYELFNAIAIEINWNIAGSGIFLFHRDICNIRSNKEGTKFFYTKNWFKVGLDGIKRKNREPENEPDWQVYEAFNANKKKGKQLLYIKTYRPNLDVYSLPNYVGAVQYIDVDTEIANYHYNNLKNGFSPTYMLKFFNGIPTEEEQKKIEKQIKEKLAGSSNAGKFILNFSDGEDRSAKVEVIPMSDSDEQFKILNETVQQEIFSGHNVTSPMLFGIKEPGQLGGRNELIEANELFENTYARPRKIFIENIFQQILQYAGIAGKIKLGKLEPIGIDYTTGNPWTVLTDEEKREKLGLPKLETKIESSDIVDKLNTMSPLVANKILNSLSADELRGLIGMSPNPNAPQNQPEENNFMKFKADHILYRLENCGEKKSNYEILEALPLDSERINFIVDSEKNLFAKKSDYLNKLNADDLAILDLLSKDNMIPSEELAKALKKSEKEIQGSLRRLEKNGLFKSKENKGGIIIRTPVEKAIEIIEKKGAKTEEIFVKYSYEWLPGFSDRDLVNSRTFCRELMKKDRLYTREEIERLNNETDLNVWESRGGWYTEPGTDVRLPSCRHVWMQNLVRKIK